MAEEKLKVYLKDNAQLMAEFDHERNVGIDISIMTSGSHTKLWWKCSLGHSWPSAVSKRFLGQSCPYCSGKKAWKGYNDLSTTNPELVSEWDFEKNEIPVYEYRPMSNKKVWWKCENGHSWDAVIAKRVIGEKCPVCQGKRIEVGYNDLATTHPSLVLEWDYEKNTGILPTEFSKGSDRKVWWICKQNHSWKAAISSRVSGVGCPTCAKELQSSFPEKALYYYVKKIFPDTVPGYKSENLETFELDIYIPSLSIGIEYDGERWHQNVDKDLRKNKLCADQMITLIRIREPKCPILTDNIAVSIIMDNKKTGLYDALKNLFMEITKITNAQYQIDINLLRDNTEIINLLEISGKKHGLNSVFPDIAKEWDFSKNGRLLPDNVTAGSDKRVWWICPHGHSYLSSVSSRVSGRGCSICSGKKILKGYNDFESNCPDLAKDWDYQRNDIKPDMVAYGSDKKFWWTCDKGHSYRCSINHRRAGQTCYYCSGKRVLAGFNDISTTHPEIAHQWCNELNELNPTEVSAGSHKKVWWQCVACGNKWEAEVNARARGSGCPACARKRWK